MDREALLNQLNDLMPQLKRAMHMYASAHYSDTGFSPAQLQALHTIYSLQPVSHKKLAKCMQMTPGAISQVLEPLHAAGSIVRTVDEADRRINYLSVSREGKKVMAHYDKLRRKLIADATEPLSEEQLHNYAIVQQTLIDWLDTHAK